LLDGGAVVQHLQELDLGGAQVDEGGLEFGFVLNALQFDSVEVNLGNITGMKAFAADADDLVVVIQIFAREFDSSLGLQGLNEG
jgi:hypothetical protein